MLIYKTEEGDTRIQSSQERLCQMLVVITDASNSRDNYFWHQ
jgi:hypothetical protein